MEHLEQSLTCLDLQLSCFHDHVIVRAEQLSSMQAQLDDVKSLGESPSVTSLPVHSESEGGKPTNELPAPPRRESAANVQPLESGILASFQVTDPVQANGWSLPHAAQHIERECRPWNATGKGQPVQHAQRAAHEVELHGAGFRELRGDCLTHQAATFVEPRF